MHRNTKKDLTQEYGQFQRCMQWSHDKDSGHTGYDFRCVRMIYRKQVSQKRMSTNVDEIQF